MKKLVKSLLSAVLAAACLLNISVFAAENEGDFTLGNSHLNILNGGIMLTAGDTLYFSLEGGIFAEENDAVRPLCAADAENLNLFDDYIYFTSAASIFRVPEAGGEAQRLYTAEAPIKQLYVISGDMLFLSEGSVYELGQGSTDAEMLPAPENVLGLIPTQFGNLYLTGVPLDYTVYAESVPVLQNVTTCYTDSGCLVAEIDSQNYQAELSALFNSFDASRDLQPFNLHGTARLMELLAPDDENAVSDYNENTALTQDFAALLREAGLTATVRLMTNEDGTEGIVDTPDIVSELPIIPTVSQGQLNIVKRARQLHEIKWTPLEDRYQWGYYGVFKAETTYSGVPYGQPVNANGYVGYGVSIGTFSDSMLDNTSRFYSGYSTYNKIAPIFSTDCSGFVSYAWGIPQRKTTYSLQDVAERVGDQSIYTLQVGDCMNKTTSHVVLVSDVSYDAEGRAVSVTIMEQTPVITKLTKYGEGSNRSLASLQSYYLGGGYVIYRYPERDTVPYVPNPAVPLDNEVPDGMKNPAPKTKTSSFVGGKTVALSCENGGEIYYTLDGSAPTQSSRRYTGELTFTETTQLRAIAPMGQYSDSKVLSYTVKVPQAETPKAKISSGLNEGSLVESGTKIVLTAGDGAAIYYTTDGGTPSSSAARYTGPITVTKDMTIRAIAEKSGQSRSEIMSASYQVGEVYIISASAGTGGSISPSGDTKLLQTGSKKYTIAPKTGYEIKDVLVDGVSIGQKTEYEFTNINANHQIEAVFAINADIPFTDVPKDAWYREAVSYAYAASLFNGTSDTAFSPDQTMNRGMFVTVLGRSAGVDITSGETVGLVTGSGVNIRTAPSTDSEKAGFVEKKNTPVAVLGQEGDWYKVSYGSVTGYIRNDLMKAYTGTFSDVPADAYYSAYAQWAYLAGVTSGTSGTTFSPDAQITREQMCTLLYKYSALTGAELPTGGSSGAFPDDGQISAFAKDSVYALRNAGIINGMGDGSFAPQGTASRAQVAQVFMKYLTSVK